MTHLPKIFNQTINKTTKNKINRALFRLQPYIHVKASMICHLYCNRSYSSRDGNSIHAWFMSVILSNKNILAMTCQFFLYLVTGRWRWFIILSRHEHWVFYAWVCLTFLMTQVGRQQRVTENPPTHTPVTLRWLVCVLKQFLFTYNSPPG